MYITKMEHGGGIKSYNHTVISIHIRYILYGRSRDSNTNKNYGRYAFSEMYIFIDTLVTFISLNRRQSTSEVCRQSERPTLHRTQMKLRRFNSISEIFKWNLQTPDELLQVDLVYEASCE